MDILIYYHGCILCLNNRSMIFLILIIQLKLKKNLTNEQRKTSLFNDCLNLDSVFNVLAKFIDEQSVNKTCL